MAIHQDDEVTFDMADLPPGIGRRALEVAAAGGHNMLLVGPPGSPKAMLARRLTSILPVLTSEETLMMVRIQGVAGLLQWPPPKEDRRPFRAPHHTVSDAGLRGRSNRPGEVSLAHAGVLLLDEVNEFRRAAFETLQEPLSKGLVFLEGVFLPARFLLVAATNPCPCGYLGVEGMVCNCTQEGIATFRRRSESLEPFLDLRITLSSLAIQGAYAPFERSAVVRHRVERARAWQLERLKEDRVSVPLNGQLSNHEAQQVAGGSQLPLAILRVARTLADLDEELVVARKHIDEAATLTEDV